MLGADEVLKKCNKGIKYFSPLWHQMCTQYALTPYTHQIHTEFTPISHRIYLLHQRYTDCALTLTPRRDPYSSLVPVFEVLQRRNI